MWILVDFVLDFGFDFAFVIFIYFVFYFGGFYYFILVLSRARFTKVSLSLHF